ncbi:hypothetical protein EV127DRAFT_373995 [Xylaria flabelliformis]|nr:hypothetical protein EV127DRAFT_373995 [Xylaria flabelliformis]
MNPGTLPFRPRERQDIPSAAISPKPSDSRSEVNCRFYQRGLCRNGYTCPFRHVEKGAPDVKSTTRSSDYTDVETAEEKVTRSIGGALAHFEAGAAITKVLFTSDLSAVQLTGLPRDSTPASVLSLLRSRGLDTSMMRLIRVVPGDIYSSARAEAEDPHFAELVMAKFGRQITQKQGAVTTAAPIPVETFSSSDSSALRVDCKKVHCSWHKPTQTVWLSFGHDQIAKRVREKFKKGEYKVCNQLVRSESAELDVGRYNPKWIVCLTDVPSDASQADMSRAIQLESDVPRGIKLGKPAYTTDAETCATTIQSLFTAIGPLEWWEFTPDTTGKRVKASARFSKEEDAKEAVRTFHNSPLPFHKTARLTVQLVYSARFKVSSLIYEAVERQIKTNIPHWKTQHVYFTAYDQPRPPKWYRTLKIEGEDDKSVAEAKNIISAILAGTVAKEGLSSLWQPALRVNGEITGKLTQIQQQTGVVIIRNKAKSELRLFGPPKRCEEVQAKISEILRNQQSEDFSIELDNDKFLWARLGGYKKLATELGPDSVRLDITSTPKRIIITGTASKYDIAHAIINGKIVQSAEPDASGQDCSVCWTEAENAIQTRCGHAYCLDCFENLCLSAPTQDAAVQIRCVGNSGSCNTILGLPQLQEHLSSSAFEELLEKCFASYVRRRPDLLRYCPSPDCNYTYRTNGAVKMLTCSSCLVSVCTSCHAQHGAMSCAEYQDVSSGRQEANERLKKEMGIKDCPKCKTPLEKTEGCNHVACRCGAHICWVCSKVFEASSVCYTHMRREHGGIGLEHYQERFGW